MKKMNLAKTDKILVNKAMQKDIFQLIIINKSKDY